MSAITAVEVIDVRFPTSRERHGSDALNTDPDYSAAYVVVHTADGGEGHGLAFTNGRGTEVVVAAIRALQHHVTGRSAEDLLDEGAAFPRRITRDSQIRWLGPEKGVVHLAAAALVNAVWDLAAKRAGKPLWRFLADLPAERLVACADLSYLSDALTADEALTLLRAAQDGRADREKRLLDIGLPSYTTSVGWLGYPDDEVRRRCRAAVVHGWTAVKMKVGADLDDDLRRAAIVREEIGSDRLLMLDANQAWEVDEAITAMERLAAFDPWWIEEPTNPDDVLGHARIAEAIAPVGVATGENTHNRVMFKQLLQAGALRFLQVDACRLAGVNEVLAVLLLAAKHGVAVCPHAGGVGLCEYVQHLTAFDHVRLGSPLEDRMVEFVDHLHEHFVTPVELRDCRYVVPTAPGYSVEMHRASLARHAFPEGSAWAGA